MRIIILMRAVAVATGLLSTLPFFPLAAFATSADYRLEALSPRLPIGKDVTLSVRLVYAPTGKPVRGAVIFRTRLDMSPEGMGDMAGLLTPVASSEPGVWRYSTKLTMAGADGASKGSGRTRDGADERHCHRLRAVRRDVALPRPLAMPGLEPSQRRYRRRRLAVLLAVSAATAPALASAEPPFPANPLTGGEPPALGARVDELLELGRRLNPGVAVRALEAEAALARADAAGRFPDPMFTTEFEDMRASGSGYAPESLGRVKYTVAQTIPLWGKRGLERRMASAEADAAQAQRRVAEVELDQRIKVVCQRRLNRTGFAGGHLV